jgi:N-acetylneuraminate synthase/N,N'-diacetyllegionaminate synthase
MVESEMDAMGFGDLFDRIDRYELTVEQHADLRDYCAERGVTFLSTPFSAEAVDRLETVGVPAYKIGSGELTNYHLLKTAADTGKPLLISTGMADWETVARSVKFVSRHAEAFALLYCVSSYPLEASGFSFGVIDRMKREFDVPVGFSDHSQGIKAAVTAMGQGADFVEKHFTLDRRLPEGDQEVSIEPEELASLVEYADLLYKTGGEEKSVREDERSTSDWATHSIVAATRIEVGESLTNDNLTTKRPGTGIPATRYFEILGKRATETIQPDTLVHADQFDE